MAMRMTQEEYEAYIERMRRESAPSKVRQNEPSPMGKVVQPKAVTDEVVAPPAQLIPSERPEGAEGASASPKGKTRPKPATDNTLSGRGATEEEEQITLFEWAATMTYTYPDLRWLYHVPNGGSRGKAEAGRFRAMGVKSGVPDVALDIPRGGCHGLRVEMKRPRAAPSQAPSRSGSTTTTKSAIAPSSAAVGKRRRRQ